MELVRTYRSFELDCFGLKSPRTIKIFADEDPPNPREWDNLGTMLCLHRHYDLGDPHQLSRDEIVELVQDHTISLPLYLYDHSGITMSTDNSRWPFNCRWDAGLVGYIIVSKEKVRREHGWKRISPQRYAEIVRILRLEVQIYDRYLRGEAYGYLVEDEFGEEIDSCWGFFEFEALLAELSARYPLQDGLE